MTECSLVVSVDRHELRQYIVFPILNFLLLWNSSLLSISLHLSLLSFLSLFCFLHLAPHNRRHAPDSTNGPDWWAETEPATVRPVQRSPSPERRQSPHATPTASRPPPPGWAPYGWPASHPVPGPGHGGGPAGSIGWWSAPGEGAGCRGRAGSSQPTCAAAGTASADAVRTPPTDATADAAVGHAARTGSEYAKRYLGLCHRKPH